MKRMNYIRTLYFSAIIAGLGSMVSCGDAKYDALDTHAYIEELYKPLAKVLLL